MLFHCYNTEIFRASFYRIQLHGLGKSKCKPYNECSFQAIRACPKQALHYLKDTPMRIYRTRRIYRLQQIFYRK